MRYNIGGRLGWCVLEGMWRDFHYGNYGWWLEKINFVVCIVIMCDDDNVGVCLKYFVVRF